MRRGKSMGDINRAFLLRTWSVHWIVESDMGEDELREDDTDMGNSDSEKLIPEEQVLIEELRIKAISIKKRLMELWVSALSFFFAYSHARIYIYYRRIIHSSIHIN